MKNLKLILISTYLLFVYAGFAQRSEISGIIVDNETGDNIPFATVSVFDEGFEKLVRGSISDGNGEFLIENPGFGTYNILVSFIGYRSDTLEKVLVSRETSPVRLGEVRLFPAVVRLEDVEVRGIANTTSRKIDRQTYRAQDFETAQGGTAVDVLNKLPSISVDPDGTVSLRGTTQFMVYLNGKPTQMEASVLLGQISANSIESIDVITVPTARYDAQGKGGIINISTKTTGQEGLSVSANGMLGGAPWGDITDKYSGYDLNDNRYNVGLNTFYRKNKLTLFAGVNASKRNVNGSRTGDARLLQPNGSYFHMVAGGERPECIETYSANAGFDYTIGDMNSISGSYYYGNRTEGRSAFYVYNNFFADINKQPINGIPALDHWVYNPNTDNRYGIFHTGNIDYTHKFINNSQLLVSFLVEHSALSRELENQDFAFNNAADEVGQLQRHFRQSDDTPLDGYRLSVEYNVELNNEGELGIGFQPQLLSQSGGFSYDTLNISSGNWGTNAQFNNYIDLQRNIYAGYVDYTGGWGTFDFIAGMRVEYTDQVLELENPDYLDIFNRPNQSEYEVAQLNWFPTLHAQYGINEKNTFIFAASRRINRPPTKDMAPFLYRRHYEVYVVGDPALKPEYLSNAELSLNHKFGDQNITFTGFMRGTNNAIFRVNTVFEEENVLIRSYTNSGNVRAVGGEVNTNLTAGNWGNFFIGGSLYNFKVEGDVFGFREKNESTNWSLKGNMNFILTRELKFTVDFDFRSASVTTQGRNEMFYMSNAALNYSPEEMSRWNFGVKVLDILSSNVTALNTRAYDLTGNQIFYQEVEYDRFGPILELSASYSLNMNGKSNRKADSTFGKEQF